MSLCALDTALINIYEGTTDIGYTGKLRCVFLRCLWKAHNAKAIYQGHPVSLYTNPYSHSSLFTISQIASELTCSGPLLNKHGLNQLEYTNDNSHLFLFYCPTMTIGMHYN